MSLKSIGTYLFGDPFRPILFSVVAIPIGMLCMVADAGILSLIGLILVCPTVLWLFAALLYQLFTGQWRNFFATLLFIITIIVTFGLMS